MSQHKIKKSPVKIKSKDVVVVPSGAKMVRWNELYPIAVPADMAADGVVAVFRNDLVVVSIKETESPAFVDPEGRPHRMVDMAVQWWRESSWDIPRRILNKVRDELLGPNAEVVQLHPAAWRKLNLRSTHLWGLPEGAVFPLGLVPRDAAKRVADMAGVSGKELEPADKVVCIVPGDPMSEVFADVEEAKSMYEEAGSQLPDTHSVVDIQSLSGRKDLAWTESAQAKAMRFMASQRMPDAEPEGEPVMEEDEMFPDAGEQWTEDDGVYEAEMVAEGIRQKESDREQEERMAKMKESVEASVKSAKESMEIAMKSAEDALAPKSMIIDPYATGGK